MGANTKNHSPNSIDILAKDHGGMRVDYIGLLGQCRMALFHEKALAEMLRQLEGHLEELGKRWYAGDITVVDQFLQLYCIEHDARVSLKAKKSDGRTWDQVPE
ncbi:MAG: hypothetical protein JNM52_00980 [Betaproteobacteria bacterium]|nr:hypothetical protein [Betaproteobacteria bacterium]